MSIKHFLLGFSVFVLAACNAQPFTNDLVNETSAYLKLHAHNPVDWKPWKEEVLQQAKQEDKLLIISIGYVSCHWCHVMEEEAFSDELIAQKMNANFVSVKVDREERPDIDKIYMNAAMIINGSGGWPLNVIALPDGRPVFAGTYFPADRWDELLDFFIKLKAESPDKLESQAQSLQAGLNAIEEVELVDNSEPIAAILSSAVKNIKSNTDKTWGGTNGTPKFPLPVLLEFQLQQSVLNNDKELQDNVLRTLDKILEGGIYDHLGGGFFRYSTDAFWKVPHFEKMLYDNAQLISVYSNAFKLTGKESYKRAIKQSLTFMEEELTDASGLFYSSIDADSEGEEGRFYIWNDFKVAKLANEELLESHFGIDQKLELDSMNVLYINKSVEQLAAKEKQTVTQVQDQIDKDIRKLKKSRFNRVQPFHDKKIITSWNSLMIDGYLRAFEALGDRSYKEKAIKALNSLLQETEDEATVTHLPKGKYSYLEDAAFLSYALIRVYQNTFDVSYLEKAKEITQKALDTFEDKQSEFLFYSAPKNGNLVVNVHEVTDNEVPGSNSQMAINLYLLGHYFYDTTFINKSEKMLNLMLDELESTPRATANWGRLAGWVEQGLFEIAIIGENSEKLRDEMSSKYIPNAIYLGSKSQENLELLSSKYVDGKSLIYVCKNKSCRFPVSDVSTALKQLEQP